MGNKMRPGSAIWLNRTTGQFQYWMDEHREMNCNMDFERYPMDEQICYFKVLSGSYGLPKLVRGKVVGSNSWINHCKYWKNLIDHFVEFYEFPIHRPGQSRREDHQVQGYIRTVAVGEPDHDRRSGRKVIFGCRISISAREAPISDLQQHLSAVHDAPAHLVHRVLHSCADGAREDGAPRHHLPHAGQHNHVTQGYRTKGIEPDLHTQGGLPLSYHALPILSDRHHDRPRQLDVASNDHVVPRALRVRLIAKNPVLECGARLPLEEGLERQTEQLHLVDEGEMPARIEAAD